MTAKKTVTYKDKEGRVSFVYISWLNTLEESSTNISKQKNMIKNVLFDAS